MLRPFAVSPQSHHGLEVALADVAGEPGLLGRLLVLLAVVVRKAFLLLIEQVDRFHVIFRVVTNPP